MTVGRLTLKADRVALQLWQVELLDFSVRDANCIYVIVIIVRGG
jgi:hypothetical protein